MFSKFCVIFFYLTFFINKLKCNTIDHYHDISTDLDTTERNRISILCMDIKPQHSVNIEQIMGLWYGNEIIMHTGDVPGVFRYDSCVRIHLADITQRYNYHRRTTPTTQLHSQHDDESVTRYLRLVWSEKDDNLEYTFNYTLHNPGLWTNMGEQQGSFVMLDYYTQFSGTIQVVKAVNSHLVLTFCGNSLKSSIYTIVLSRSSQGLSSYELRSIRELISRRGLATDSIRKVCTSAGSELRKSMALLTVLLGVLTILRKSHLN